MSNSPRTGSSTRWSASPPGEQAAARKVLSTRRVMFLVIAAAAPMAAIAGDEPLALVRGNGISLPAAYVVAAAGTAVLRGWWLPRWLDRCLPHLAIVPSGDADASAAPAVPATTG